MAEIHPTATVYPGTVLGDGVRVLENAVVGKQPALGPKSTAKREPQPPAEIGEGTIVSTGAIVFAGAKIGAACIIGDQSCVRERVTIADDVVVGRGSLVENDTTIGSGTRIQAHAYVTAYSTLEQDVFIAPCVVMTNDNFMGRTERRKELMKGPTIRRGARIGGGDDRAADQRPQHDALEPEAERHHAADREQRADPKRRMGIFGGAGGEEAGEHDELALGEIDRIGRLVDQHEAERDQRIKHAANQTLPQRLHEQIGRAAHLHEGVDEDLVEEVHAFCSVRQILQCATPR